jgi:hypothetical protein
VKQLGAKETIKGVIVNDEVGLLKTAKKIIMAKQLIKLFVKLAVFFFVVVVRVITRNYAFVPLPGRRRRLILQRDSINSPK